MFIDSASETIGTIVAYIFIVILILLFSYFVGWNLYVISGFIFFFLVMVFLGSVIEKWMNDSYKCDFWLDSCSTLSFFGFIILTSIIAFGFIFLGYCGLAAGNIYILFAAFVLIFLIFLFFNVVSVRRVRYHHENKNK